MNRAVSLLRDGVPIRELVFVLRASARINATSRKRSASCRSRFSNRLLLGRETLGETACPPQPAGTTAQKTRGDEAVHCPECLSAS